MSKQGRRALTAAVALAVMLTACSGGSGSSSVSGGSGSLQGSSVVEPAGSVSTEAEMPQTQEVADGSVSMEVPEDTQPEEPDGSGIFNPEETGTAGYDAEKRETAALLAEMLRQQIAESYDYCTVDGTPELFTISLAIDGTAAGVYSMTSGAAPDLRSVWESVKDGICSVSLSAGDAADAVGLTDAMVMVQVLNDLDHSKVLLSVLDGEVVYDCAA